jgi:hypothetical protein
VFLVVRAGYQAFPVFLELQGDRAVRVAAIPRAVRAAGPLVVHPILRFDRVEFRVASLAVLRAFPVGVHELPYWIRAFRADLRAFRADLQAFRADLQAFRADLPAFQADLQAFRADLPAFQADLRAFRAAPAFRSDLPAFQAHQAFLAYLPGLLLDEVLPPMVLEMVSPAVPEAVLPVERAQPLLAPELSLLRTAAPLLSRLAPAMVLPAREPRVAWQSRAPERLAACLKQAECETRTRSPDPLRFLRRYCRCVLR